ncbi:MAG: hypothetical protein OXG38_05585 [Chloroflexi bacterium]|nr:hypothetical protein [Chloroflexota bacterium]
MVPRQVDATVGRARDAKSTPLTTEQFEATLNRALLRQAAVIITINTAIMTATTTAIVAAFT